MADSDAHPSIGPVLPPAAARRDGALKPAGLPQGRARIVMRWVLAALYATAGVVHLASPSTFLPVMPDWVPWHYEIVIFTGICELIGAAGLLTRRWRWWAGVGLAAYAVCVYPANLKHAWLDVGLAHDYATLWYHVPRLPLQAVLIWWALYAGGVTDWPWRKAAAT